MAATQHDVTFYRSGARLERLDTNIDPRDYEAGRALLERLVRKHKGTLNLDLSQFWLEVIKPGNRPVEVRVTSAGRTTINGKTEEDCLSRR
jgi:hypothetical protein